MDAACSTNREMTCVCRVVIGKSEGKGRPRCRLDDNIKVYLQ
jgi:hypothetical protein